jgi:hypothetical protein
MDRQERWKWKIVGITAGLLLSMEVVGKVLAWLTV